MLPSAPWKVCFFHVQAGIVQDCCCIPPQLQELSSKQCSAAESVCVAAIQVDRRSDLSQARVCARHGHAAGGHAQARAGGGSAAPGRIKRHGGCLVPNVAERYGRTPCRCEQCLIPSIAHGVAWIGLPDCMLPSIRCMSVHTISFFPGGDVLQRKVTIRTNTAVMYSSYSNMQARVQKCVTAGTPLLPDAQM